MDQALDRSKLEQKDRAELATIVEAMGGKASSRAKKADLVDQILTLAGVPAEGAPGNGAAAEAPADTGPSLPEAEVVVPSDAAGEDAPAEWEADAPADEAPAANGQATAFAGDEDAEPGNRRRRRRGRDRNRDRDGQPMPPQNDRPQNDRQPQGQQGQQGPQGQHGGNDQFDGEPIEVEGWLDLRDEGYGFLRVHGYLPSRDDVYVSVKQARQFGLRRGDHVKGASRPAGRNEKNPALLRIDAVNGKDPEQSRSRRRFEDLTPLFPDQKLRMELPDDPTNMTARIIDLMCPIGKGQRGLIVSPPKAGKTTVMKQIARSIELNHPEVKLIVLLVDERPEEVTDFRKWLVRGEVAASTFDRPAEEHTHVAELTIERAKRMVEEGDDVCIILDGITRLARAYNLAAPASGRIMSGGIDAGALYPPKKFFGAARNVEEGGSLTILATALVETNSRMDEHIFEEFKGTGNMELKLDRKLAERRIYPAIDVDASSTRHEELLIPRVHLNQVWKLRRVLSGLASENGNAGPALELLTDRLKSFKSNDEFLTEVAKAPAGM
jgi:transcription termination factor Rho